MNQNNIIYIILGASIFSQLLPILIGKRKNNPLLWVYVLTGFCFDIILTTLKRFIQIEGIDYHLVGNIYVAVEFLFVSFYYYPKIFNNKIVFCSVILSCLFLYLFTFYTGTIISGKGIGIFILIYAIYSIIGLYTLLKKPLKGRIEQSSFFWVNTGFLIYAAGSLPIFIAVDSLLEAKKETAYLIWVFRNVLNVIKNVIFTKALTLKDSE